MAGGENIGIFAYIAYLVRTSEDEPKDDLQRRKADIRKTAPRFGARDNGGAKGLWARAY